MATQRKSAEGSRTAKLLLGLTAVALIGVPVALYHRHLAAEQRATQLRTPAPSVTPARKQAPSAASRPSAASPRVGRVKAPRAPDTSEHAKAERARVEDWLTQASDYRGEDRAAVLDAVLAKLVAAGAESVFEIEKQLAELSVYEQEKRAAAFHALGRLGKDLQSSKDPKAQQALEAIQRMAKSELELPSLIEPNPDVDLDAMLELERHELLHQGILIEQDGVLWQPTTLNKLPVIRALRAIGDEQSREQLEKLAKVSDNPVGVRFAVEEAIALAHK